MYKINDTDKYIEGEIKKHKQELSISFKKNFETQEKTLELFSKAIIHAKFNAFKDSELIWNTAGFLNIISLDLKIIGQDILFAENEWQKRHYSRQATLIIYESINDFFDLLGHDFRKVTINIPNIQEELKSIKSDLNEYKIKYYDRLKDIRNIAIGHRDNDTLKQINLIKSINWSETIEMVTSYDKILDKLGKILQKLLGLRFD